MGKNQTKGLSLIDKNLTLWIFLAMALGTAIGHFFPSVSHMIDSLSIGSTNIPMAIGLIIMMYPPLAKVNYALLPSVLKEGRLVMVSILLNWVIGPFLMFGLSVLFLSEYPDLMTGVILIGLARCIAMVLVWNDLAEGHSDFAAGLVALNSIFQVFVYAFYAWFFITWLPPVFGLRGSAIDLSILDVAESVSIYLGIPFLLGFLTRRILISQKGVNWYDKTFIPRLSPFTLIALLFTIVLMFSLKGGLILSLPHQVLLVGVPLLIYFLLMFGIGFFISKVRGGTYEKSTAVAFTAAGNNFELAIAVAISVFGIASDQAFVGVVGPLIEVPALLALVKVSFWIKEKYYSK